VIDVMKFTVSTATPVGYISLYDAATLGNELARIPVGRNQSRYFTLYLYPTPSAVLTYTLEGEKQVQDLSANNDEPLWPEDFHWLLSSCARYDEYLKNKDRQIAQSILLNEIEPGLKDMLAFVSNSGDRVVVPGTADQRRIGSNLGSYYPSGYW
jgi:hypothetical protein